MKEQQRSNRISPYAIMALALSCAVSSNGLAQAPGSLLSDVWQDPVLPRGLWVGTCRAAGDGQPAYRGSRVYLFRMPSALPACPPGLDNDADSTLTDTGSLLPGL